MLWTCSEPFIYTEPKWDVLQVIQDYILLNFLFNIQ